MYSPILSCPLLRYYGSSLSSNHLLSPLVSWLPPLFGMIKVNFGGFVMSSAVATANVIRNQYASFIQAGGKLLIFRSHSLN